MTVCMLLQMMPPIQFTSCNVLHIYIRYIDYILYVCYIKLPWHVTTYFMYTFFKASNESGLQFFLHQGSVCPEKWNLSTTKFRDARRSAVGVNSFLLLLVANLFRWHPSS